MFLLFFPFSQRIPRYELLFREVLKHTPKFHPDRKVFISGYSKIKNIARAINEEQRQLEEMATLLQIQSTIRGDFGSLLQPHRRFVRSGPLRQTKASLLGRDSVSPRIVYLFSDLLIVTDLDSKFKSFISMEGALIQEFTDGRHIHSFGFKITPESRVGGGGGGGGGATERAGGEVRRKKSSWNDSNGWNTFDGPSIMSASNLLSSSSSSTLSPSASPSSFSRSSSHSKEKELTFVCTDLNERNEWVVSLREVQDKIILKRDETRQRRMRIRNRITSNRQRSRMEQDETGKMKTIKGASRIHNVIMQSLKELQAKQGLSTRKIEGQVEEETGEEEEPYFKLYESRNGSAKQLEGSDSNLSEFSKDSETRAVPTNQANEGSAQQHANTNEVGRTRRSTHHDRAKSM